MTEVREVGEIPEWELCDRMRISLRTAGISPGQMAEYLEVGRNTVSTWINGHRRPNPATLRQWALRTGVPYLWLRDGDVPPPLPRLDSNQQPFDLRSRLYRLPVAAVAA